MIPSSIDSTLNHRDFERILGNLSGGYWEWRQHDNSLFLSASLKRLLGYSDNEPSTTFLQWENLIAEDDKQKIGELVGNHIKSNGTIPCAGELRIYKKDGSFVWMQYSASLVWNVCSGVVEKLAGCCIDISEKKQLQETLQYRNMQYRCIFENLREVYFESLLDGTLVEVSHSIKSISRYTSEELLGKNLYALYQFVDERNELIARLKEYEKVSDYEIHLKDKDGSIIVCAISAVLVLGEGSEPHKIIGALRDISLHKKTMAEIVRLASFPDLNPNPIIEIDKNNKVSYANAAAQNILLELSLNQASDFLPQDIDAILQQIRENPDYPVSCEKEICGRVFFETFHAAPAYESARMYATDITRHKQSEEDLKQSEELFHGLFETMVEGVAIHTMIYDGRKMPIDYQIIEANSSFTLQTGIVRDLAITKKASVLYSVNPPPFLEVYAKVAETRKPEMFETYFEPLEKYFSISVFSPRKGYFATIFQDITEKKKTQKALQNAQKLESIGVLAGGIAHDFNNLLSGMFGYVDMARMHFKTKNFEQAGVCLEKIVNVFDRTRSLTRQLMTFAKEDVATRKTVVLTNLIKESAIFSLTGSNVKPVFSIAESLWACDVDEHQIGQVIDNIVINARQAMPHGGDVAISAENCVLDTLPHPRLQKGPYIHITIQDSGEGIPQENLALIFDPFFTTKKQGNGLGLATSYSIAIKHLGALIAESAVGMGAIFHIYLPASSNSTFEKTALPKSQATSGNGKVLIMDDEPFMLEIASGMLESLGYECETVSNGAEAVSIAQIMQKKGNSFLMAILDLTIPGGHGGKETVQDLQAIMPDIKCIASSGYADDPVMATPQEFGFHAVLRKPYVIEDLIVAVREACKTLL